MDIEEAIRVLEAAGYAVVKLPAVGFACKHGHNHKSAEARVDCDFRMSRKTGMTMDELAASRNDASRPRYIAAYRKWLEVRNYRIVGEEFGVTRNRARQMAWRGWRYCFKDGTAGDQP